MRNTIRVIAGWALLLSSALQADTLITMLEGSGQPASDASAGEERTGKEVQIWSRPNNMARVNEGGKMVFSIDRGVTYMIDDTKKTCSAFKHPKTHETEPGSAEVLDIQETGDNRKVGDWDAKGYAMSVPLAGSEEVLQVSFWVTDELTTGLDTYRANFAGMTTPQTAWMSKTLEMGGYPVYQESSFGSMTMWSKVLSVSEEQAPEGIYEVPAGYTGCTAD